MSDLITEGAKLIDAGLEAARLAKLAKRYPELDLLATEYGFAGIDDEFIACVKTSGGIARVANRGDFRGEADAYQAIAEWNAMMALAGSPQ